MNTDFNAFLNKTGNLLLLLIGMESLCLLCCDTFRLSFSMQAGIWLALSCFLLWVCANFRRGFLIAVPICALALYLLFRNSSSTVLESFQNLATQVADTYYHHFSGINPDNTDTAANPNITGALLSLLFLLAVFVSFALSSASFRISLSRIATLPLFIACIIVNGSPPVLPVLGLLVFWVGLQIGGDSFRENDGAGKALLIGLLPCLLVLGGLLLLYRPSTYHYDQHDIALSMQFDRLSSQLSSWFGSEGSQQKGGTVPGNRSESAYPLAPAGWKRNEDGLDLTCPFDYSALPETAMIVRTDVSGTIYLRGKSYGDYTGTTWGAAVEEKRSNVLDYFTLSMNERFETAIHAFDVTTPHTYDVLYLPYYTKTGKLGDVAVPSTDEKGYRGDFYRPNDRLSTEELLALPVGETLSGEEKYREFAHSYYTRLPDSTRMALLQICEENGFSADRKDVIDSVASFVQANGIYDLNVEPYPDSDYALYFLSVSHRGYCIHFATAAVALFRALNIPARICEGYMFNSIPNNDVRVTGENAHAWAEVYLDGFGWYPVEVTASEGDASAFPEAGNTENTLEQQTPADLGEGSIEANPESSELENESASDNSQADSTQLNSSDSTAGKAFMRVLLLLLGIPVALVVLLFCRYTWIRNHRKKLLSTSNSNQQVILYYRWALRATQYGKELPKVIQQIAEKAAFSQHEITPEELSRCATAYKTFIQESYQSLSKWKQLVFQYLGGNI